jgi:hypothetical protein
MKQDELTQKKINEHTEKDFLDWFREAFQTVAIGLGYAIGDVLTFIANMGYAFADGFKKGFNAAMDKGRSQRERIKKRNPFGGDT